VITLGGLLQSRTSCRSAEHVVVAQPPPLPLTSARLTLALLELASVALVESLLPPVPRKPEGVGTPQAGAASRPNVGATSKKKRNPGFLMPKLVALIPGSIQGPW
jgi:hypothetical protein